MADASRQAAPHLDLSPTPSSVPRARAFVRQVLRDEPADLVDSAELCASELVTNAVLHARTEIGLRVERRSGVVRLVVRDGSSAAPRRVAHSTAAATGRGLELLGLLASGWGIRRVGDGDDAGSVDEVRGGKEVWCELAEPSQDGAAPREVAPSEGLTTERQEDAPRPTRSVVLVGYPVRRGIRAREHLLGLVRECYLLTTSGAVSTGAVPARLSALASVITSTYATVMAEPDRQREEALRDGVPVIDLRYPVPEGGREVVEAWRALLGELDDYARGNALLTLETPQDLSAFNDWATGEFVRQLDGARPTPWSGGLD